MTNKKAGLYKSVQPGLFEFCKSYLLRAEVDLLLEFELLLEVALLDEDGLDERTVVLLRLGDGLLACCTRTELAGRDCLCWRFIAGR